MNVVTASLIAASVLFDIFVFIFVKDLKLYGKEIPEDAYRRIPMQPMASSSSPNVQRPQSSSSQQYVEPYATTPLLLPTIQENDSRASLSPSGSFTPADNIVRTNSRLNDLVYAEIAKNNPNENLPLNFNLQTDSDISGPTSSNRVSTQPGPSSNVNPNVGVNNSDTDSDLGVNYPRLIRPSQMKEIVKRQSQIAEQERAMSLSPRAQSPETDL